MMAGRKAFIIKVQLDVEAVTCPGVWLCSNGQVSLQIYMLDSCVQTSSVRPCFPMLFHENFCFSKTLPSKYQLEDLKKQLGREWLYVELIQWENCETGNVLSYFQIPLNEFLYPTVCGSIPSGTEVDLLMEPTPAFPGAIAPKLEVNTKTRIDETVCTCIEKSNICSGINPKTISSFTSKPSTGGHKAVGVCHFTPSKVNNRNKKCLRPTCSNRCKMYNNERPPFRYRRVDDGFLQRQRVLDLPLQPIAQLELDGGPDGGPYAGPNRTHPDKGMEIRKILKESIRKALGQPVGNFRDRICTCGEKLKRHTEAACTVCQKYSGIFSNSLTKHQDQQKQVFCSTVDPNKNLYKQLSSQAKKNRASVQNKFINKNFERCEAHSFPPHVCVTTSSYNIDQSRESMAQKIHRRISRTLQSIPRYFEEVADMCTTGDGYYEDDYSGETYCGCQQNELPDMVTFYNKLFHRDDNEIQN